MTTVRYDFLLQKRLNEVRDIWGPPDNDRLPVGSASVATLREVITKYADGYTYAMPEQYRIITRRGEPVERWKVRPGSAKKLRRKS